MPLPELYIYSVGKSSFLTFLKSKIQLFFHISQFITLFCIFVNSISSLKKGVMKRLFTTYIPHSIAIMGIILGICYLVNTLRYSSAFLDPVGQTLGNFTMTDSYFQIENTNAEEVADFNTDIILYDLSTCYSRAEIAAAIQAVHDAGAKCIALDCIFGPNNSDPVANDSLTRVISRCKNVIAACRMVPNYDTFIKEESFFVKETGCVEACVNVQNDMIRNFYKTLEFGDTTLSTFVHEIVKMSYPEIYENWEKRAGNEELIHYKQTMFEKIHIYDDFYPEDFQDKVVLVGDFQDLRDFHNIPIAVNGARRICGTTIHGYAIATLTTPGRLVTLMPENTGILLGIIYTLLYCIIYCWINEKYNDVSGFLSTSLQIIMMLGLVFFAGWLFLEKQYNITLVYALVGTGMAAYAAEIFYYILFKIQKIWAKRHPNSGKTFEQQIVEYTENK